MRRDEDVRVGLVDMCRTGFAIPAAIVLSLAAALGGCSGDKKNQVSTISEPDPFPARYRVQIASLLSTNWKDAADFYGAMVAQPTLKKLGDGQHYVVCVLLNGHNQRKTKVAIYLTGSITQFVDAPADMCADATYQPFPELQAAAPAGPPPPGTSSPEYGTISR
jgi:hypothetical protein